MYLFDYTRWSEVLLHSHSKVKPQSPLIDQWPSCTWKLSGPSTAFTYRVNSACFVQVNRLLLSKTYKKLIFGQGEPTVSWGETTFSWGETTLSWGETTLSWGETTLSLGETTVIPHVASTQVPVTA